MKNEIKIGSWNVNSINARLENLIFYLKNINPDILLLQELKCLEDNFPYNPIEELGYNIVMNGQKSYNGVAILSKFKLEDVSLKLPCLDNEMDDQARFIEAIAILNNKSIRVSSIYVPNGGANLNDGEKNDESEKFIYKMNFFDRLYNHFKESLRLNEISIFGGDYNVAHKNIDVYDPKNLDGSICFHYKERKKFNSLLNLGYQDSFRIKNPNQQNFSWWDYRGNSFKYNKGMRIDYLLTSPLATDHIKEIRIDDFMSQKNKPSDHAPILGIFQI